MPPDPNLLNASCRGTENLRLYATEGLHTSNGSSNWEDKLTDRFLSCHGPSPLFTPLDQQENCPRTVQA